MGMEMVFETMEQSGTLGPGLCMTLEASVKSLP